MAFDPDAYLKQSSSFDPDAYLGAPKKGPSQLESGLQGAGQAASFGYLPQLQAATEKYITDPLAEAVYGVPQTDESFVSRRDRMSKRDSDLQSENPLSYGAGQLAGAVATPIPMVGAAKLGKAGAAALSGAAQSALYNPGDVEGELSGLQLKERGQAGLLGGALSGGVAKGGDALIKMSGGAKKASQALTAKAIGAQKGDFVKLMKKGNLQEVTDFAKNKGLLGPDVQDTYEATSELLKTTGKEIGDTYKDVIKKMPAGGLSLENATPDQIRLFQGPANLDTKMIAQDVLGSAEDLFNRGEIEDTAYRAIRKEAKILEKRQPNLEDLFEYRKNLDDRLQKIYKKPAADLSDKEEALLTMRNSIKTRLDNHIEALDSLAPSGASKKLKELNNAYKNASEIKNISERAVAGDEAKMAFGLPDRIVGGAVGLGSVGQEVARGDFTPEDLLYSGGIGLLAAGGSRFARNRGPALGARALDATGRGLIRTGQNLQSSQVPALISRGPGRE